MLCSLGIWAPGSSQQEALLQSEPTKSTFSLKDNMKNMGLGNGPGSLYAPYPWWVTVLTPGCCETLRGRSQDSCITSTGHKGQVTQHNGADLLQHGTHPLTSFSPQILLIIELEAGLEEGPRTPTTPLGRI